MRATLGLVPGSRIWACTIGTQRLADEQPERGQWGVDSFTENAHFLVHDCTDPSAGNPCIKRPRGPVYKLLLEPRYRMLQTFFLLSLHMADPPCIDRDVGHHPLNTARLSAALFPRTPSTLRLKVVP